MYQAQRIEAGQPASDNTQLGNIRVNRYTPISKPEIGRLILTSATHIKPNQPLIHKETGDLEVVSKDKYFSPSLYNRYYILTEEKVADHNLVYWVEGEQQGICMATDAPVSAQKFACYPCANSIIERLHTMYYDSISEGNEEYIRFTKIHNNKYAGLPSGNRNRIPADAAKERWKFIFNHVLMTNPTNIKKKRIGVLFGTIAGADLTLKSTIDTLNKYRDWIIS